MSRWVGVAVVVVLLVVAWIGYDRPDLFPGNLDMPRLIYLTMMLLLVSGAGYGFWRFRVDGGRAVLSIVIWGALILAITFAYDALN